MRIALANAKNVATTSAMRCQEHVSSTTIARTRNIVTIANASRRFANIKPNVHRVQNVASLMGKRSAKADNAAKETRTAFALDHYPWFAMMGHVLPDVNVTFNATLTQNATFVTSQQVNVEWTLINNVAIPTTIAINCKYVVKELAFFDDV